jgi:hypothetical protein
MASSSGNMVSPDFDIEYSTLGGKNGQTAQPLLVLTGHHRF